MNCDTSPLSFPALHQNLCTVTHRLYAPGETTSQLGEHTGCRYKSPISLLHACMREVYKDLTQDPANPSHVLSANTHPTNSLILESQPERISCLIKTESSINKSAVPPQPPLFPLTHTHLHLRPLASFTTAVLSETIQSRSHMAEEDSAGQDGMVRATVEPQMRFSFYLPKCAWLLSARLNTTDPTLLSWKTRQRRREGKGKRNKSRGGG